MTMKPMFYFVVSVAYLLADVVKAVPRSSCSSMLDCCGSPCNNGTCSASCMAGYTGPRCCQLDLGACNVALHPNNTWTWGAAARWMKGGGVEVMGMGLQNQCGINNYRYVRMYKPTKMLRYIYDPSDSRSGTTVLFCALLPRPHSLRSL